jgi:hypothetical protein
MFIVQQVVLQVVITFIVEAFVISMQATQRRRGCSKHPNDSDCVCRRGMWVNQSNTMQYNNDDYVMA